MIQLWTCAACGKKFATEAEARKCFDGHRRVKVIPETVIVGIKNDIILAGVNAKEEGNNMAAAAYADCLDMIEKRLQSVKREG